MKPSEKIAILRHKKSYSVTDIAMKLDLSSYEVMDWEEGKKDVPDEYLYPLCSLLGISVSDFLDNSYIVEDDVVNHEGENEGQDFAKPSYEEPIFESPKEDDPFADKAFEEKEIPNERVSPDSEKLVKKYKRIIFVLRIVNILVVLLFASFIIMAMRDLMNGALVFVWIFFSIYFLMMLFIFTASTGVKKFRYKGHDIVILYIFVVNRAFVDGVNKKITVIPGLHKGEAAIGFIEVGGEKLHYGAHRLYTEDGKEIKPIP